MKDVLKGLNMNNRPDTSGRTRIVQRNRALQGFNNHIL